MRTCLLLLAACICIQFACKKEYYQAGYLAGRLVYTNPNEPTLGTQPLAGKQVMITTLPSDTLNFQYSVTTDKEGYFVFQYLDKTQPYLLFFEDSIGGLVYKGQVTETPDNAAVLLKATVDTKNQNGFRIIVHDPSNEAVAGAQVCVFNSNTGAVADTCTGSLYSQPTNNQGEIVKYNLVEGKYYFVASATIGGRYYKGNASVQVSKGGVVQVPITLQPVQTTGFQLFVTDQANSPVNDAEVCVFTNYTQFQENTCTGSIFTKKTDASGKAFSGDIGEGKYYFVASAMIGGRQYKGNASVQVSKGAVAQVPITLQPVPTTGFQLFVTDQFNSPVNGAEVCVFTNYTQFLQDTCTGSIFTLTTDALGKTASGDIGEAKYYLRASVKAGDKILKKLDSVIVNKYAVASKSIQLF
jgi:hypothetical protein